VLIFGLLLHAQWDFLSDAILKMEPKNLIPVLINAGLLETTWKPKEGSFPGDFIATKFSVGFGNCTCDEQLAGYD